ncbi:variable surface lipoprotein [Metamycoplasma alkalescens]|uniref:variable surface lipoprotein n=1 Tax=Metamycoplasma alkalescens TaxID=45363 RepID=UPI003D0665A1
MKKINKVLLSLGFVSSILTLPLIAAKCGNKSNEESKPNPNPQPSPTPTPEPNPQPTPNPNPDNNENKIVIDKEIKEKLEELKILLKEVSANKKVFDQLKKEKKLDEFFKELNKTNKYGLTHFNDVLSNLGFIERFANKYENLSKNNDLDKKIIIKEINEFKNVLNSVWDSETKTFKLFNEYNIDYDENKNDTEERSKDDEISVKDTLQDIKRNLELFKEINKYVFDESKFSNEEEKKKTFESTKKELTEEINKIEKKYEEMSGVKIDRGELSKEELEKFWNEVYSFKEDVFLKKKQELDKLRKQD